jgi:uncharacterized membrane protein YheB (UPF0754 family)
MKRLTLEIDLSENEIFDEEVTKAVRAKVREAVRNARSEDIDNEVQQEVERLFDNGSWDYKRKLKNIVKSAVYSAIEQAVKDLDIKEIVETSVAEKMDDYMSYYKVRERCEEALNAKVQGVVEKKIKELLN